MLFALLLAFSTTIRSAADLAVATFDRSAVGTPFEFDATLLSNAKTVAKDTFSVGDSSGAMILLQEGAFRTTNSVPRGTKVRVSGIIAVGKKSQVPYALCRDLSVLGSGAVPDIPTITGKDFVSGRFDCYVVRIVAKVRDVFPDEIDPGYTYLVLDCDGETVYLPQHTTDVTHMPTVGTTIEASGICIPSYPAGRRHLGRMLSGNYRVLSQSTADPFTVPALGSFNRLRPPEIARLGQHLVRGRILAVWHGDTALLKADDDRIIKVEFAQHNLPTVDASVEVVGFPESDLYNINLTRAIWRTTSGTKAEPETPTTASTESLLSDSSGHPRYDFLAHGRLIRLSGIVRNLPGEGNDDGRFNLESGRFIVPIDVSSCPNALSAIGVGYGVEVSGVCVMETENWRPNAVFPRSKGFTLVVRDPDDIRVVSRPSWWTPSHTLSVVGALLAVLVAILIWNLLLRRVVERRSRALEKEITARIGSDLKVYERTRLAVELHDSLAQNLSGVSFEIDAASDFAKENPDEMMKHLGIASSALKSCRDELRNCLWDLRNQSLEDEDMDTAIRRTLTPHLAGAKLSVRFNVPRTRLPDNVAHAILRIIRELTVNAVRHGHAKDIKVAGCIENGHLLFSVRDNGCGFDPDNHPGVEQGHYGLQGICERAEDLDGDMSIESRPGHGAKVTVRIDATPNTKAGNEQ